MPAENIYQELKDVLQDFKDFLDEECLYHPTCNPGLGFVDSPDHRVTGQAD